MTSNRTAYAGLFSAIAASLCCITPVLALLSGTTGIASTFSWVEPYRPILIGITVLILGFAWYQKLKIFAGIMLAFPYYSHIFYSNSNAEKQVVYVSESNVSEVNYSIQGMTCAGCEAHIENEVNKLEGILEVDANYETSKAFVKFDKSRVTANEIVGAIGKTGYKIIE